MSVITAEVCLVWCDQVCSGYFSWWVEERSMKSKEISFKVYKIEMDHKIWTVNSVQLKNHHATPQKQETPTPSFLCFHKMETVSTKPDQSMLNLIAQTCVQII